MTMVMMIMMTILNIRDPLTVNKIIYDDNNNSLLNDKEYDHKENIFNSCYYSLIDRL